MTKGRIFKGIILTVIFGAILTILFLLVFSTTTLSQVGFNDLVFGGQPVAMTALFSKDFTSVFLDACKNTWLVALTNWGKEFINFFKHLGDTKWWASDTLTNSIVFWVFALVLVVYAVLALYYLIGGLFVYKKKKSAVLNIIWTAIPTAVILWLLVGIHGALYGNAAFANINAGGFKEGPAYLLFAQAGSFFQNQSIEMATKAKLVGFYVALLIYVILLIVVLYQTIGNVWIGTPRYLSAHKYDYLEKLERKRREKFYKTHGYENIANQPQPNGKKGKKGTEYASNNPYVQQQQAAMGVNGQPYPYAAPYGYPYGGYAAPTMTYPPMGGNTVHTGNNAPLIVQYITNGSEGNGLRSTRIDDNTTSIYGTSRVHTEEKPVQPAAAPAAQPQVIPQPIVVNSTPAEKGLTKNDIKDAILEILKETNVIIEDEPEPVKEEPKKGTLEDQYDVLSLDDLKTLIKDSVSELLPKEEPKKVEPEVKPEPVAEVKPDEAVAVKEPPHAEPAPAPEKPLPLKEEDKIIPPIVVAIPTKIEKEEPVEEEPEEEEDEGFDETTLREMISKQLLEALKDVKVVEKETVQEVPVYVKEVEKPQPIIKEVIKEVPVVKEVVKEVPVEKRVEVVKEVPVIKEVPVVKEPEPVVEEAPAQPVKRPLIKQPEVRGKEKELKKVEAVKLNFSERLLTSGPEIVLAYNSLKNLLLSYGLKDRVSNSGDTFRLHKNTYCKITMGGSHLKIYLALNPKNYLNSAIPVGDASFKDLYKDIPLVFRVKSDLSLRRARDLINDCMNSNGLTKVADEGNVDYASELKNL